MKKVIALIATIILMVVCFVGMAMLCGLLVEKALLPSEYCNKNTPDDDCLPKNGQSSSGK